MILLFLVFVFPLFGTESLTELGHQAEALWGANDFSNASSIYEQMLDQPLLEWQKSRLYYNLGTVRLSQNKIRESLDFYKQVSFNELLLPQFQRQLNLNQGIAYLNYAKTLSFDPFLSLFYVKEALKWMDHTHEVVCAKKWIQEANLLSSSLKLKMIELKYPIELVENETTRFSLLKKFIERESSKQLMEDSLNEILKELILSADVSWELFILSTLHKMDEQDVLMKSLEVIHKNARFFVPAILKKQQELFEKKDFREFPSFKALQSFEKGLNAIKAIKHPEEKEHAAALLQKAIKHWSETCDFLCQSDAPKKEENTNRSIQIAERIQEMFFEDQAVPESSNPTLHSW